jgi:triosephosphate isomerase
VALAAVRDALAAADPGVAVGAQDVHHELAGAYTGDISAPMLVGLAGWVIVGHSERRRDHGETDEQIGRKLARAVEAGLRPILCVGEQLADRDAGRAIAVVDAQLAGALAGHDPAALVDAGLVIAYEPVWAIGTGRNALGSDAAAMAEAIRTTLARLGWGVTAGEVPILYGGSVTAANIGEFLAEPAIDEHLDGDAAVGEQGRVHANRPAFANRIVDPESLELRGRAVVVADVLRKWMAEEWTQGPCREGRKAERFRREERVATRGVRWQPLGRVHADPPNVRRSAIAEGMPRADGDERVVTRQQPVHGPADVHDQLTGKDVQRLFE